MRSPIPGAIGISWRINGYASSGISTAVTIRVARGFGTRIIVRDGPVFVPSNDGTVDIVEGSGIVSFSRHLPW